MAFRAFYALPVENFGTSTGQATNAVYGFISMLVKLLRDEEPTHVAVAWDLEGPTFRDEAYADYKLGRSETPADFPGQVELMQELLRFVGLVSLSAPGFEADDVIATLATQGAVAGMEVRIASGDRDAFQLVSEDCTVLYPGRSLSELSRITPEQIQQRYGVPPERYRELAALVGETADNLPGVPGVGPKTAAKWLTRYGSLADLLQHAAEVGGKAGQSLRDHLDNVLRNHQLNRLATDVSLEVDLAGLKPTPVDSSGVNALFDQLEFASNLRDRLFTVLVADTGDTAASTDTESSASPADTESPHGVVVTVAEPGELGSWLGTHAVGKERAGLAVVGSWGQGTGELTAVAIAVPGACVYVEPSLLNSADETELRRWLAEPTVPKAIHDSKGPLLAMFAHGWDLKGLTSDPALAAYLMQPGQRKLELADLCQRYLGVELAEGGHGNEQLTLDVSAGSGTDHDEAQRHRLGLRAEATRALARHLDASLQERGAAELLRRVELPLVHVLATMERAGIAADHDYLDELDTEFAAAVRQAVEEAHRLVGRQFNLGSPKQLQQVLFEELSLPKTKRIKTGYTTDADALHWLTTQTDHELPAVLLRHRDQTKLRTTVEGLIKSIGVDGRIHTTYNQAIAATGRLSSAEPNLQNIPVRTTAGRRIRRAFVVGSGFDRLLTADYSQIELRIMAHMSQDAALIEAFQTGHDFHAEIAARVFGTAVAEVDTEARARIKAMNYGLAYGLSEYGLAQQLGVAARQARELMEGFFAQFGGVRDYLRDVVEQARRDGYTETMLGRRRYLPELTSDNRQRREMAERMALNAPIQGSAADIIKVAMLEVDVALREAGLSSRMLLQVHDELVCEVSDSELSAVRDLVTTRMMRATSLSVPLEVSVGIGENWRDAAH